MCELKEESFNHFMKCSCYQREEISWEDIYSNDNKKQFEIGKEAYLRLEIRKRKKEEDGRASLPAPTAPDLC